MINSSVNLNNMDFLQNIMNSKSYTESITLDSVYLYNIDVIQNYLLEIISDIDFTKIFRLYDEFIGLLFVNDNINCVKYEYTHSMTYPHNFNITKLEINEICLYYTYRHSKNFTKNPFLVYREKI